MGQIKIDLDQIVSIASDITQIGNSLNDSIQGIDKWINKANKAYVTKTLDEYSKKYNAYLQEAEKCRKAVDEYAKFLIQSTGTIRKVEADIDKTAVTINAPISEWK